MKTRYPHLWQPDTTPWKKVQGAIVLATPVFLALSLLFFVGAERLRIESLDYAGIICGFILVLLVVFDVVFVFVPTFVGLMRVDPEDERSEDSKKSLWSDLEQ